MITRTIKYVAINKKAVARKALIVVASTAGAVIANALIDYAKPIEGDVFVPVVIVEEQTESEEVTEE